MTKKKLSFNKIIKKFINFIINSLNDPVIRIGLILILVIFIISTAFYYVETKDNHYRLKNLFDSFYYTITTLTTVGYGDISPFTNIGKIIAVLTMIFGVIFVGAVTGKFSSFLVDLQLKRGKGLLKLKNLQNHFIICGWKNDYEQIIMQIIDANPEFETSDIVLINNTPPEQMDIIRSNPIFKSINYIFGDFIDESVLLKANIKTAKRILVLADTSGGYNPIEIDSKTVMAVITIEKINRSVYTIAELLDEKFEKYLQLSHCDEIILSRQYERSLLVNASSGSGISHVVRDLMNVEEMQKISIKEMPKQFLGQNFKNAFDYFMNKDNYIMIGLLENTGNIFKRKEEALNNAQKTADISKLIENLQKVKVLKANNPVFNPGFDYIIKEHSMAILIGKSNLS